MQMGQPNPGVKLQMSSKLKLLDTNNLDEEEIKLNDFMTKCQSNFLTHHRMQLMLFIVQFSKMVHQQ